VALLKKTNKNVITQLALAKTVTVVAIALATTVVSNSSLRLNQKPLGKRVALLNHQSN
jgi:hypothetical protein